MIGGRDHGLAGREAWAENLRSIVGSIGIPQSNVSEHLTTSVAIYCQQYLPHGAQRSDLILLIARAFCAVNDHANAARVLRSTQPQARHIERWMEILAELHHFPLLLPYFSLGIIRPADWAGARLDRMWILDLGRLMLSDAERHEMMLYGSLRALVEKMLVFWDATQGEGVLGIKDLAAFNVEAEPRTRQTSSQVNDLLAYVENVLRRQKDSRGWRTVPTLLNLDL